MRHQVGAQGWGLDPDMNMHAADQHAAGDATQRMLQRVIAFLAGVGLILPVGERMTGYSDRGQVVFRRPFRHAGPQAFQVVPRGFDRGMGAGADLDLALQELGADLSLKIVLAGLHQRFGGFGQLQAVAIDQQVFLFNSQREFLLHGGPRASIPFSEYGNFRFAKGLGPPALRSPAQQRYGTGTGKLWSRPRETQKIPPDQRRP